MAWFEGTATSYKNLLAKLVEFAKANNVQSITSVDAGGTGWAVGDIADISGGTSTTTAQIEVTAESAGVVTAVRVFTGGAYSVNPGLTQTSLTGGAGGTGLDVTITMQSAGWTERVNRAVDSVATAVVNAGGSSYSVNDTANISGGTVLRGAIVKITAVSAGVVTGISIEERGFYTTTPGPTGIATTSTQGGSGLTLDLTYKQEDEVILEGSGGGSDEIFIGVRTLSGFAGEGFFNWEIAGMTGFTASEWSAQPGISRGRWNDNPDTGGCFVPLRDVSMSYWMSITSSRIIVMARVGSNTASCYMGFIDPTSTPGLGANLYPYPLLISASSSEPFLVATSATLSSWSGFHDPVAIGSASGLAYRSEFSCCQLNSPGNTWLDFRNSITGSAADGGTARSQVNDRTIHPIGGHTALLLTPDNWPKDPAGAAFDDFTTRTLVAPGDVLKPTPGAGGDEYLMVPFTMISYFAPSFVAGQIKDSFWFSADGAIADNGSVINAGGNRYRVFQSGRFSDPSQWFAVLEG